MHPQLVTTIRERCRVCYTCVRECPAKAIRIRAGRAEVIAELVRRRAFKAEATQVEREAFPPVVAPGR